MALTMKQLRKLADDTGLKYFLSPEGSRLMLSARGPNGLYQFLILLELEGRFLQFRTLSYLHCPDGHEHLTPVLRVIADITYRSRLVKYSWDSSDGEVVVHADLWIMDSQVTQQQFAQMIQNYLAMLDVQHPRLKKVLETGEDPGIQAPAPNGLPDELRRAVEALLERAAKGGGKSDDADDEEDPFDVLR